MSDDEYDYDYDDYANFFDSEDEIPEGLAEHVDSLAEHTSHSPVLVNAHPDYDIEWDEWEYLTDEYYDAEHENAVAAKKDAAPDTTQTNGGKRKRKRGVDEDQSTVVEKQKKRRKIGEETEKVRQQPQQPLVVWRERSKRNGKDFVVPLVQADDGKQVALLENWRDLMMLKDDKLSGVANVAVSNGGEDDVQSDAKRKNSHKTPGVSRQSDRRRPAESRSDRQKGVKIQPTQHPPIILESGASIDKME